MDYQRERRRNHSVGPRTSTPHDARSEIRTAAGVPLGSRISRSEERRWAALCYLVCNGLAPHMPSVADGGAEGGALREKGAQAADALADGVLRWVAERQAHAVSAAAVGVERGSRDVGHAVVHGQREQRGCVHTLEGRPHVEPPRWVGPASRARPVPTPPGPRARTPWTASPGR